MLRSNSVLVLLASVAAGCGSANDILPENPLSAPTAGPCVPAEHDGISCAGDDPLQCRSMACAGGDLLWCDSGSETNRLDCDDVSGSGDGGGGTCVEVPGFVPWCVVEAGAGCAFADSNNNPVYMACGVDGSMSPTMGCDYDDGCVSDVSPCDPSDFTPSCSGDRLALGCAGFGSLGQPLTINCADPGYGGGTCDGDVCRRRGGGACYPGTIECSPPYTCGAAGTCEIR